MAEAALTVHQPDDDSKAVKVRTRERILQAAIALFARQGFEGTSLHDIASRADVRRSLILYYFTSKENLWKSAATYLVEEFNEEVQRRFVLIEHLGDEDFTNQSRALWLSIYRDKPEISQFLVREGGEPSERLNWLVEKVGVGGLSEQQLVRYRRRPDAIRSIAINTLTLATVALAPLLEAKLRALHGMEQADTLQEAMLDILNRIP